MRAFSPGFHEATRNAAACSYGLSAALTPAQGLALDGQALTRDAADGFSVSGKTVVFSGAACATLRDSSRTHTLSVTPACTP